MYSLHTIKALSKSQISRLLNGHGVRVSHGGHHKIHLSHEQSKKHHKASREGKGYTLHFDPYQMAQHQHLRGKGTGSILGKTLGGIAGSSAEVAGTRLNDAIMGTDPHGEDAYNTDTTMTASGMRRRGRPHHLRGKGTGTILGKTLGGIAGSSAEVAGTRLNDAIMGTDPHGEDAYNTDTTMTASGIRRRGRPRKVGGAVNRINKFNRWTGVLGDAYQGIAHAVKPVAQPIFQAGTARAVGYINPTTPQDYMNNSGMGIKRRGRPRKVGGAVNRINKFNRWTGVLGDAYQGIAHAVKPVAQPIFQAGTARAVGYINPTTPQDYYNNSGMGIKRRGRPRKMHGGYVSKSDQEKYPGQPFYHPPTQGPLPSDGSGMRRHHKHTGGAMFQSGLVGYGVHHKKKVVHRKKKHVLLFDL